MKTYGWYLERDYYSDSRAARKIRKLRIDMFTEGSVVRYMEAVGRSDPSTFWGGLLVRTEFSEPLFAALLALVAISSATFAIWFVYAYGFAFPYNLLISVDIGVFFADLIALFYCPRAARKAKAWQKATTRNCVIFPPKAGDTGRAILKELPDANFLVYEHVGRHNIYSILAVRYRREEYYVLKWERPR